MSDRTNGASEPGTSPRPDGEVELFYFFIPLPNPWALPDKHIVQVIDEGDVVEWEQQFAESGYSAPPPEPTMTSSLRFHQVRLATKDVDGAIQIAVRRALPALRTPNAPALPPEDADGVFAFTIVEAAAMPPDPERSDDPISDMFDNVLDALRGVTNAYHAASRLPARPCVRERLPPVLPVAHVRTHFVEVDGPDGAIAALDLHDPDDLSLGAFVVHMNVNEFVQPPELSSDQLTRLHQALEMDLTSGPFARLPELRHETRTSLSDGDYFKAVILEATACEVLLADLLLLMLWEEVVTPSEVAGGWHDGLRTRVRRMYHPRLGGDWSVEGSGPLAGWDIELAGLRHRIVHTGHRPTLQEARAALRAADALDAFVVDRLMARLDHYPVAALMYLGRDLLEREGGQHERLQALTEDSTQPDWIQTFGRWREAVFWLQSGSMVPAPDLGRARSVARLLDGQLSWWLHDRYAARVCAATPTRELPTRAQELIDEGLREGHTGSIMVASDRFEPVEPVEWRWQYEVLPLLGVMRDGSDLTRFARH